jgi:transcriptional regulator with XRE-family HTH domain/Zn-dependent peptidase ImmA (M78 family)
MIRNERQYRVTIRQRQHLADTLDRLLAEQSDALLAEDDPQDRSRRLARAARASLAGQIADLDAQIREYELLRAGTIATVRVSSFADLPDALVRARIASGLTQRELAERLQLKEQQIQRYESERYAGASLSRLQEVMSALGVELEAGLALPARELPISRLRQRIEQFGLDRRVVNNRLLRDAPDSPEPAKFLELVERTARLLAIPLPHLLNADAPLPALATTARFKTAKNADRAALDAYTRYAESIADIVLRSTHRLGQPARPGSAQEVRAALEERAHARAPDASDPLMDSSVLLAAALDYLKDLRIPVVAMRDPGAFHGACFTREGRSVIVLKQTTDSAARWLHDLLHELDHVLDVDHGELRTWIELGDISEWSEAPEEQHANNFAADVLFSGRAEPVLTQALQAARGAVQRLKTVVPQVAKQAEVPVDVLANHIAFRLTPRGINWWGTAATFQRHTTPWRQVNDILLQQLDLAAVDPADRAALVDVFAT